MKNVIAHLVAERVVDRLETIEVDEQRRERRAFALAAADPAVDLVVDLPEELREQVMISFFRLEADRSRKTGGVGLGLAIVKHILDRHDARLLVRSEPGKGSVFECQFSQ